MGHVQSFKQQITHHGSAYANPLRSFLYRRHRQNEHLLHSKSRQQRHRGLFHLQDCGLRYGRVCFTTPVYYLLRVLAILRIYSLRYVASVGVARWPRREFATLVKPRAIAIIFLYAAVNVDGLPCKVAAVKHLSRAAALRSEILETRFCHCRRNRVFMPNISTKTMR